MQQRRREKREADEADERDTHPKPEHAPALLWRQTGGERAQHDDIVAREHQIDHDHLPQRREPRTGEDVGDAENGHMRSEEHTSELQSLMHISYAVFCLKKKKKNKEII